jgi:hypothetical protein
MEVPRCKYCHQVLEIIPGHRHKQYCNDACRQAAHRARMEKARLEEEERDRLARVQSERALLIDQYGPLLPDTLDLLQSLQSPLLVQRIAKVIVVEKERARQDCGRERNTITEELLLLGEQIGFSALHSEVFDLEAGVAAWLAFCDDAGLQWLYLAKDAAYLKIQSAAGRKRLAQVQS